MYYINFKGPYGVETVDEFENRTEAGKMCREYNIGDRANYYYVSSRSTREWRESK